MTTHKVIGIMSGTSLDGVDVALCEFSEHAEDKWQYEILSAKTYQYSPEWHEALASLHLKDAAVFMETDTKYGCLLGDIVNQFCNEFNCHADIIASHGHTIFHNPGKGYTTQIGSGAALAAIAKKNVVTDFRSMDVVLGGQGAPLVPIGDKLLFSSFDSCINLGGFANISFDVDNERIAFDICPVNIVLNHIFSELKINEKSDIHYDEGGNLASTGKLNAELYSKLNKLSYYDLHFPKSLGREWLETQFLPVLYSTDSSLVDKLNTVTLHIAFQIVQALNKTAGKQVLITGGGAYNHFLISCIKQQLKEKNIVIPDNRTVEFKEALVFSFLGLLRFLGKTNCLRSVTGAKRNSCSGAIYNGK